MILDPRYFDGIDHFNRRDFYAAHDAWEALWLERTGEEKDFLQGLILCAVALLHATRGNLGGARSRYRTALEYLEKYPPRYGGIDLRKFLRRLKGALHRILTEEAPPPIDLTAVPTLTLESRDSAGGRA